jgi:hypothetical protein
MNKIIVTHKSPDMDGITSVWLLKKFLPGWEDAKLAYVPAGEKLEGSYEKTGEVIEVINGEEVIHVDTGLGPLDHHQTMDEEISAASLTMDHVIQNGQLGKVHETKREAIRRMVDVVVDDDHFQDVFQKEPLDFGRLFSLFSLLDGLKLEKQGEDDVYTKFAMDCLDMLLHVFENRIWAENEVKEKGVEFETKWGKGLGIESINDQVLEYGQKSGYELVIRKDPNNGFVRIKALPKKRVKYIGKDDSGIEEGSVNLTPVYEKLKELDPYASWYLHVSNKMLLNGSSKGKNVMSTKLSLNEIIDVIKNVN